jgi:hypothetical protein
MGAGTMLCRRVNTITTKLNQMSEEHMEEMLRVSGGDATIMFNIDAKKGSHHSRN